MASAQTTQLLTNLQSSELATKAPSLYNVIRQMILSMDNLSNDILTVQTFISTTGLTGSGADVLNFNHSTTENNIILSWDSLGVGYTYEIREGSNWDTANYITSSVATTVPLDPRVVGNYTFLIKAVDTYGRYSANAATTTADIAAIGNITATYSTISNSVLLYWSKPTSVFRISHYEIYRGTTLLGEVGGTFFAFFETVGGTYSYSIVAIDIVGNTSPTDYSISIPVGNPLDFILLDSSTDTAFAGTKTNAYASSVGLVVPVDTVETWTEHYVNNSWTTPAAQIAAGFDYYIQPTEASASYVKVIDFGAVTHNTSATISYVLIPVVGTVSVDITLEASDDGATYGTPVDGNTGFFASIRYLRITLDFTPTDATHDFAILESLTCDLNVQLEMDGGNIEALSTDASGTVVTFSKSFLSIVSITVTAYSLEPTYCVYDFTDTPNPTQFKVLVFDSSGNRISKTVSWKARGVI